VRGLSEGNHLVSATMARALDEHHTLDEHAAWGGISPRSSSPSYWWMMSAHSSAISDHQRRKQGEARWDKIASEDARQAKILARLTQPSPSPS
jgi:hypothetical protein